MIRLAVSELRADWRLWAGPFVVLVVTSTLLHLATIYWWSVGTDSAAAILAGIGGDADELRAGAYLLYVCTGLAAMIVLGSVAAATVDAQRVRIARWRLTGALPRQVRGVILVQLVVLAVLGALGGVVLALPFAQPVVNVMVRMGARQDLGIASTPTAVTVLVALGITLVVCLLAAIRPAFRAARVSPVEALRSPIQARRGMSVGRWIMAGIAVFFVLQQLFVSVAGTLTLGADSDAGLINIGMTNGMMIGVILVILMALLAPLILSGVLRLWGALLPAKLSVSWFLARYSTTDRLKQSTAAVIPLMVGVSLYGIFFGMIATWQASLAVMGSTDQLNTLDTYVMLTPAALIAATGSIATVFMTSRSREHEFAVLRTAGATKATILGMTIAEATLYTLTAILLSLVSIAAAILTVAATFAFAGMPFTPALDPRQALVLCAAAFAGMVLAVAIPGMLSTRAPIRRTLAPQ